MSEANSILSMSDETFGWYVSGFIDGEGCFILGKQRQNLRAFTPRFSVGLRADDGPGLRAIAQRFGVGKVYFANWSQGKSKPKLNWQVSRLADLATVIVPHFDRFPLQMKKARDFLIWREAILLMWEAKSPARIKALRRPGRRGGTFPRWSDAEFAFISNAADRLRDVRKYGSSPTVEIQSHLVAKDKRTLPLFED